MLCEKSHGNISGVLELMNTLPLAKIEKIYEFWTEITLPLEEREKRMRSKADKAAQNVTDLLLKGKTNEEKSIVDSADEQALQRFQEILKRKT